MHTALVALALGLSATSILQWRRRGTNWVSVSMFLAGLVLLVLVEII